MAVYFIEDNYGNVKIGRADNPARRLQGLQTGHPSTLTLARVVEGDHQIEHWFHKRFSQHWIRSEWYEFVPEMLTVVPPPEIPRQPLRVARKFNRFKAAIERRLALQRPESVS